MDIDIDWCLTCEKRISSNTIYCSPECQQEHEGRQIIDDEFSQDDEDEDLILHKVEDSFQTSWIEDWEQRIQVWAAQIPPNSTPPELELDPEPKTPELLKSHKYLLQPTLAISTPYQHLTNSISTSPLETPKRNSSSTSIAAQYASLDTSAATTESSIATPASAHNIPSRKPSMLDIVYDQVRSWVAPSPIALSSQQHLKSLYQQHPPTEKHHYRHNSSPRTPHILSDQTTVCWVTGTIQLDLDESSPSHTPELHHPSFQTRGRRASRVAA